MFADTLTQELASYSNDPDFFAFLNLLPNPDPILRKLGRAQEAYERISYDAHVMGELRSIRAGLLSYEWHLQAGGTKRVDKRALQLCEKFFQQKPSPHAQWADITWQMAEATFFGHRTHELVWKRQGDTLLPCTTKDIPNRRLRFSPERTPLLRTRVQPFNGEPFPPYKLLLTRHMPTYENPYGVAVFSSIYWLVVFKHTGVKAFTKFIEKFGIPLTLGKYPLATSKEQKEDLEGRLTQLVEASIALLPEDVQVSFVEVQAKGEQHTTYLDFLNREMSKALTSQTLATEIQGQGSRAAAEVHAGRADTGIQCDRQMISDSYNTLLQWITEINFPDATPPYHEFFQEEEARQDWAVVFDKVRPYLRVSSSFASERLQIPLADEGEEILPGYGQGANTAELSPANPALANFARTSQEEGSSPVAALVQQGARALDQLLVPTLDEVERILKRSNSLEAAQGELAGLYQKNKAAVSNLVEKAYLAGQLYGFAKATDEADEDDSKKKSLVASTLPLNLS